MKCKSFLIALATLFITITGIAQTKTVTDVDGNVYHTVTIGNQTWMVENLSTTRYNDSTAIPNVTDNTAWGTLTTPAYCWYNNDAATNKATYGALYNWYAVNTGKLAPKGWHVPTDAEWTTLINYLITNGYNYDGTTTGDPASIYNKIGKALASTTHWTSSSNPGSVGSTDYPAKRNATGFTALQGGFRFDRDYLGNYGTFACIFNGPDLLGYGIWWSSSKDGADKVIYRYIQFSGSGVGRVSVACKGYGYSVRCILNQAKITVIKPLLNETILADAPYTIKWKSSEIDSIKIDYSIDDGKTFQKITSGIPAKTDSFVWHVPRELSSKCKLVLTNIHDPLDRAVLSNFHIKGYELTRFKANGDYEKFDPALHAWQFDNSGENMWPVEWYMQFNYSYSTNGRDPYTNKRYPVKFSRVPILAFGNNFIDWPLFVKTFRQSVCYKDISKAVYSPTALKLWSSFKDENYRGTCFGFSQSSLLAFDRPAAFLAAFPGVGNFQNIHDLPLNNSLRLVINQLYEGQVGRQHKLFLNKQYHSKDVRKTLAELRSYFLSDTVDHRALSIITNSAAHSIVPYRLEKLAGYPGQFVVWCYDNEYPSGISENGKPTAVVLDSINNQWVYAPFNWVRSDGLGVNLNDPASTYLDYPVLWSVLKSATSFEKSDGATTYLDFYNTISSDITITNPAGQSIGFADSGTYNTLGDGIPIIPQNSANQPPIGYFIPEDTYSVRMNAFTDSLAVFAVLNQKAMFNYWRSDAVKNQTDRLVYDGGLGFRNPDAQTKTINLEVINRLADCESDFQILNLAVGIGDSVRLKSPDIDRVALVNPGTAKMYDLNIVQACSSLSGEFNYHRITVPAHSTHFIVPDLQDLLNHPVKIYVDKGNTGIISDSLFISNQVTGINNELNTGDAGKFSLDQNYPNPFHTTTTIGFHIAEPGYVSLKVFDVVGAEVAILLNGQKPAGDYSIEWNAAGLRSGIYFCQLKSGGCIGVKKMLLK